jgi:hypothetical protein
LKALLMGFTVAAGLAGVAALVALLANAEDFIAFVAGALARTLVTVFFAVAIGSGVR